MYELVSKILFALLISFSWTSNVILSRSRLMKSASNPSVKTLFLDLTRRKKIERQQRFHIIISTFLYNLSLKWFPQFRGIKELPPCEITIVSSDNTLEVIDISVLNSPNSLDYGNKIVFAFITSRFCIINKSMRKSRLDMETIAARRRLKNCKTEAIIPWFYRKS